MINRRQFFQGTLGLMALAALSRMGQSQRIVEDAKSVQTFQKTASVQYIIKIASGGNYPVGSIVKHDGVDLPIGWLPADGRLLSRKSFQELYVTMPRRPDGQSAFGEIGFGKQFHIPDMRAHA